VASMGKKRNLCSVLEEKPGDKQQLTATEPSNFRMGDAELIHLKQDIALRWADVTTAMNARCPQVLGISRPAEKQLAYQDILRTQSVRNITSSPDITRQ